MENIEYRLERDSIGEIKVPKNAYWGAQTQRSLQNFKIGTEKMPKELIHAYAILKKCVAEVNYKVGVLPQEKKNLIGQACQEILDNKLNDQFPLSVWQTGSGTQTNMNINEVISNRSHVLHGGSLTDEKKVIHPNDDVNKSQSSNDSFPTAMHIAFYKILKENTIPMLHKLITSLNDKSKEFMEIIKIGRTHFMDATPLRLGQEFSGYTSQLQHGVHSLEQTMEHLLELALGGTAVGTGLNTPKNYDILVAQEIAEETNIHFKTAPNKFEALSSHDAIVKVSGALKTLAVSLMKIGNDIRMLASGPRCGIGEIILPANEPGSSIMPGKVNPTQCEALTMVCSQVIGNDISISIGGANGQFQLNVFKPMIIFNALMSARLIADVTSSFSDNCVVGIEANKINIQKNLENSLMLVTALNTHIGYDNAAKIAKKAYNDGITLKEASLQLNLISETDFDTFVDPRKMVN